jgi:hypothetical protein
MPRVSNYFGLSRYNVSTKCNVIVADERGDGAEAFGLGKLFNDPNLLGKLATNPRTQKHLADPAFVQKLQLLQQNPKLAEQSLAQDPRMIDVLGALMGIDMQGFSREEGSDELPPGVQKAETAAETTPASPPPQPSASTSTPKPATPPPAEEDVEMEDEDAKAKKEADLEKQTGAAAYKIRDFPAAAAAFEKAWEIYPKDVTFLTNLSGKQQKRPTIWKFC